MGEVGAVHHLELWVEDLDVAEHEWGWLLAHHRLRAGLNHVAFHAGSRQAVEALAAEAPAHGWSLMCPDRHPYAGGTEHFAAYLESTAGFEVELVADPA